MANIVVGARGDVSDINRLYAQVGWSEGGIRSRDHYLLAREDRRLIGAVLFWFDDEAVTARQRERGARSPQLLQVLLDGNPE